MAMHGDATLRGVTYRWLKHAMGYQSFSGLRSAVAAAVSAGLVRVTQTGMGRGARAVIKLTDYGRDSVSRYFGEA